MGQIRKRGDVYWIRYYNDQHRRLEESAETSRGRRAEASDGVSGATTPRAQRRLRDVEMANDDESGL